jgi:hypothetical protein
MKSIKPGRGLSGLSFAGSIAAVIFGIFWTVIAAGITAGAPFGIGVFFPLFGIIFIILGIAQAVYHYKNATGKDRYSIIDITDSKEEGDPSDKWIKNNNEDEVENKEAGNQPDNGRENQQDIDKKEFNFCPYCGVKLENDFEYCPKCGKNI